MIEFVSGILVTKDPNFVKKASRKFGSQCIVASIEAKKKQRIYI